MRTINVSVSLTASDAEVDALIEKRVLYLGTEDRGVLKVDEDHCSQVVLSKIESAIAKVLSRLSGVPAPAQPSRTVHRNGLDIQGRVIIEDHSLYPFDTCLDCGGAVNLREEARPSLLELCDCVTTKTGNSVSIIAE